MLLKTTATISGNVKRRRIFMIFGFQLAVVFAKNLHIIITARGLTMRILNLYLIYGITTKYCVILLLVSGVSDQTAEADTPL